jgi:hypothetical protein
VGKNAEKLILPPIRQRAGDDAHVRIGKFLPPARTGDDAQK